MEKNKRDVDKNIFEFIKPSENDDFSKMSNIDLNNFLSYLDNYYLELRKTINLDKYITFGLELEFEQAMESRIKNKLNECNLSNNWKYIDDASLKCGGEITSPILKDEKKYWRDLKKVCTIIKNNAIIDENCSSHVHIGKQILESNNYSLMNFIKLWSVYENIIFRFSYGEYIYNRPELYYYSSPTSDYFWDIYKTLKKEQNLSIESISNTLMQSKKQAVSFVTITSLNTIEFRCPNGTLNPIIWQNNVNLFSKLLLYSNNQKFDDDIITKRKYINEGIYSKLYRYHEIYLDQALELADLIFDNNFDKVYFLKQYLKSFEVKQKYEKTKIFTKLH